MLQFAGVDVLSASGRLFGQTPPSVSSPVGCASTSRLLAEHWPFGMLTQQVAGVDVKSSAGKLSGKHPL